MPPVLRLYEDVLSSDAAVNLPALPRMIFVVHGSVDDRRSHACATARRGAAKAPWRSRPAARAPRCGAGRWRRGDAAAARSAGRASSAREKLTARLDTLPKGHLLLRGDSVAFPPGGCAYLHRHQGPGIRCLYRRRHPHRHARPLDVLRPGRRLVRERARPGVRAGRRPADAFHPRHDPAGGVSRQKLRRVSSTRKTRRSRSRSSTRSSLTCR